MEDNFLINKNDYYSRTLVHTIDMYSGRFYLDVYLVSLRVHLYDQKFEAKLYKITFMQ
jgi:hypothetical protein